MIRGGAELLLSIPQNWAYYEEADHVKLFPSHVAVIDYPGSPDSAPEQQESVKASSLTGEPELQSSPGCFVLRRN